MNNLEKVYLGIGGNIGDVFANMQESINILNSHKALTVTAISPVYKTPPWGVEDQDWFLNACVELETSLSPKSLLVECLGIEKQLNRTRKIRWGPRTIDMDILIYGDLSVDIPECQIPHPRMHERAFVLKPLLDIAGDLEVFGQKLSHWLENTSETGITRLEKRLSLPNR